VEEEGRSLYKGKNERMIRVMFDKKNILKQIEDANIRMSRLQEQINELRNNQTFKVNVVGYPGKPCFNTFGPSVFGPSVFGPSAIVGPTGSLYNKDFTVGQILNALIENLGFKVVSPVAGSVVNIKFVKKKK
jgi:hypothetical protein